MDAIHPKSPCSGFVVLVFLSCVLPGCEQANRSISAGPDPQVERPEIRGVVIDEDGPVAGAAVRIKGRIESVVTDASGQFKLSIPVSNNLRVTASKPGYYIAGAAVDDRPLTLHLTSIPVGDDPNYAWVNPLPDEASEHACGNCHPSIVAEWQGTGHARSATEPFLRDLLSTRNSQLDQPFDWSLAQDFPDGVGVCASCHSPTTNSLDTSLELKTADGSAAWGVHCDFCHKVADVSLEHLGHSHGVFAMQLRRPRGKQLFFGPLEDVDRGEESALPLQRQSRFCASCHEGTLFGVPVYTTYSEWLESPARAEGRQCQTCHMAPSGQMTRLVQTAEGIERDPQTLSSHELLPGGVGAMMRRAVRFKVVATRHHAPPGGVATTNVEVSLTATDVGHRVPTGFIDRHLILVVDAVDAAGELVSQDAGPTLPPAAGAKLAGRPGQLFARLLTDPEGNQPAPFWRPGVTVKQDNRLLPGIPVTVNFRLGGAAATVRVQLLYRRFWDQVTEAKQWPDNTVVVHDQTLPVATDR